jgi:ABC-2 type transport system ATP-binding protein
METRDLIKSLAGDHTIILSTHILPEVAQTCQRVVIINKGKVVAIDTPDNLTGRLHGARSLYVQVDSAWSGLAAAGGPPEEVASALRTVPGVTTVAIADHRDNITGFDIDCQRDSDARRELARAIVSKGWGLLELRPMRLSLEEIFLQLTTSEGQEAAAASSSPAPVPAASEVTTE